MDHGRATDQLHPMEQETVSRQMKQLRIIRDLLKPAKSIIHAGDPDDEGQLLVDEVIEWAGSRLPVQRVLINDYNLKLVQRALATMRDNREFAGMSAAAEARGVGDLLYGVNMTRAYTLAAQAKGYQGVLSVGRVQTPSLALSSVATASSRRTPRAIITPSPDNFRSASTLSRPAIRLSMAIPSMTRAACPIRRTRAPLPQPYLANRRGSSAP